jgi:hypothetical protein
MPLQAQNGDEAVTFTTLTLVGGSGVNTTTLPLYPQERFGTHCAGGWVGFQVWSVPPPRFSPWTVQPTVSYSTNRAIPARCHTILSSPQ